jgi:hypothetical protein
MGDTVQEVGPAPPPALVIVEKVESPPLDPGFSPAGPPAPLPPTVTVIELVNETHVAVRYPPAPPPPPEFVELPPAPPATTIISGAVDVQFTLLKVPDAVNGVTLVCGVEIHLTGPIIPPFAIANYLPMRRLILRMK